MANEISSLDSKILVVDDEKNIRKSLSLLLQDAGYRVDTAESALKASELLELNPYALVLLDIRLDEVSGIEFFKKMQSRPHVPPVVFMSGNASLSEAVETIKLGGADFLEKPFAPEQLLLTITRALRLGKLEQDLKILREETSRLKSPREAVLGHSKLTLQLLKDIERAAPTKSKVLIQGETGTGKELIAKALHASSSVSNGPFVKVNCAAIPESLIESELFGHEKGAFTGAQSLKKGLFESAHQGTIFLDEIGEMSPTVQAKVLRVIQSQEFNRVGGTRPVKVDVRVISATHRNLEKEVAEGRFREDLFFRLNVVPLRSAALRDRKEDIPLLLVRFIADACLENGFSVKEITASATEVLLNYPWPGNVRELKNMVERLIIFSGETIELNDLPPQLSSSLASQPNKDLGSPFVTLEQQRQTTERAYMISVIKFCKGNITQAAQVLDLERTYLHKKITDYQIQKLEYF